jgi:two-component system OmpR family response regulator
MRLLLAEDDPAVAEALSAALEREGHAVDVVGTGTDAEWMAKEAPYDALIIDVALPGLSGIELAKHLRADGVWTPILMLTGHGETGTKVAALDAGADDYVVKPTTVSEVSARLRAITRRASGPRPVVTQVADVVIDPAARRAWRADLPLALTPKEFALLELLVRRRGETLSREELDRKSTRLNSSHK